jgi:hypothetical protein
VNIFQAFLAWLAWLLAPVVTDDLEQARAAAAVSVAAASMVADDAPSPEPGPRPGPKPDVCPDCKGTGWIVHGDGHRTPCPCGATPNLGAASASPATDSPAVDIPRR